MGDDFTGKIDQASTNGSRISADRNHRGADVFLEGLHQKMTQQHRIIPGGIGIEPFEGQLFMAEIFQRTVGQLITATIVVAGDDGFRLKIMCGAGRFEHPIDRLTLADVGDHDGIGPAARQMKLMALIEQTAIYSPPEALPVAPPGAVFKIFPGVFLVGTKTMPPAIVHLANHGFDVVVHFTATDIIDLELLAAFD